MMGWEHHFTMLLSGGSLSACRRRPWVVVHLGPFLLGPAFGSADEDLPVDLVVDLIRRRNLKPTLNPAGAFAGVIG